jgi:6-phosphogluconolactonase
MNSIRFTKLLAVAALGAQFSLPVPAQTTLVYVGAYTRPPSKGISAYRFDASSGQLTSLGVAAETSNPTFLAVHPSRKFLYAANENPEGAISAFAIDPSTGQLKLLNRVGSRGSGPRHAAVDQAGHWLYAANYNSGSVASFPIRDDGSLGDAAGVAQHTGSGVNPQRQRGQHAHSANLAPDGRFLLAADLGLDQIDPAKGTLTALDRTPTGGQTPRNFAIDPSGAWLLAANQDSGNVVPFRIGPESGRLSATGKTIDVASPVCVVFAKP